MSHNFLLFALNIKSKQIMKPIKKVVLLVFVLNCFISNAQQSSANKQYSLADEKSTDFRYYYFPNIEAYFDTQEKVYLYKDQGEWTEAEELPKGYGGYSLYNKVRVAITDYQGDEPYLQLQEHKKRFPYNSKGRFPVQTAASE